MKTFHHELGHLAGETMTVGELIAALSQHNKDMPVFATWEGVLAFVKPESFHVEQCHKGDKSEATRCLVIDVGDY